MARFSAGACLAADPAIPQLARLTRAPEAARLLEAALTTAIGPRPWVARGGPPVVREVAVVCGHPGSRWTLRYTVVRPPRGDGGSAAESTVFAKVYARDRGDVASLLWALRERGQGQGRPMQVNASIAYLPALRVLLLEQAPGETARAALRRSRGGIGERAARWLAAFHAAPAPLPAAYRMGDPLAKAHRWARALDGAPRAPPALGRGARRLLAALARAQPPWPPAAPRVVHGDFGASHIYLAAETTTIIDWDAWRVGDGAEDAGRFLASLRRIAARDPERGGTVTREARAFVETYRAAVPAAEAHGLAFYEALACLRKAARLAAAGGDRRRLRHAEALVGAGEQALMGDHRDAWSVHAGAAD
jgi:Phosphotransferase enzyme family